MIVFVSQELLGNIRRFTGSKSFCSNAKGELLKYLYPLLLVECGSNFETPTTGYGTPDGLTPDPGGDVTGKDERERWRWEESRRMSQTGCDSLTRGREGLCPPCLGGAGEPTLIGHTGGVVFSRGSTPAECEGRVGTPESPSSVSGVPPSRVSTWGTWCGRDREGGRGLLVRPVSSSSYLYIT